MSDDMLRSEERLSKRSRIRMLFTTIMAPSAVLFAVTLLMTSSYPVSIALQAGPTPLQTIFPRYCDPIVARRKPPIARPRTAPWEVLLNDAATNRTRLYLRAHDVRIRRLGNVLFNYASLFGIAWRNGVVPLWPDGRMRTPLRPYFSLRIPIDHNDTIMKVSV